MTSPELPFIALPVIAPMDFVRGGAGHAVGDNATRTSERSRAEPDTDPNRGSSPGADLCHAFGYSPTHQYPLRRYCAPAAHAAESSTLSA